MRPKPSRTPKLPQHWSVASALVWCPLFVACGGSSDRETLEAGPNFHLIEALPEHEAQAKDDEVVWTSIAAIDRESLTVIGYSGWADEAGFGGSELIRWSPGRGSRSLGLLPDAEPVSGQYYVQATTAKADVVWGYWSEGREGNGDLRAFRADEDGMQEVIAPRADSRFGTASLSEDGSVALIAAYDSESSYIWRWTLDGTSEVLETLPGLDNSRPLFLSADGKTALGYGFTPSCGDSGVPCQEKAEHFRWTEADGIEGLGVPYGTECGEGNLTLTSRGPILATECDGQAYLWSETGGWVSICEDAACESAYIHRISGDGSTVFGTTIDATSGLELLPWRWTEEAGLENLELPEGYSFANYAGVIDDGSIAVGDAGIDGHRTGFSWSASEGVSTFEPLADHNSTSLRGITADGSRIIGMSYDDSTEGSEVYLLWQGEARMTITEALASSDAAPGAEVLDAALYWSDHLVGTATVNGQSLAWVAPLDR